MPDYGYTKVEDYQKDIMERLSSRFKDLEWFILAVVPEGRRRALALTKLEEAAMWAAKAVSKDSPAPEPGNSLITEPID